MIRPLLAAWGLLLLAGGAWATPQIQHWTTSNGVPVYFVPAPEIPMLKLRVVFDAGNVRDGATPGISLLTNVLLGEGTRDLTSDDFHAQLEATGAQIGSGAMRDFAWVSLRSLTDPATAAPALALMQTMLAAPRFSEEVFARGQQQLQASLQNEKVSPDALGGKALLHAIYHQHPYGTPAGGTDASVAAFTPGDVQAFYSRYYVARNATVVIVGALTSPAARQLADDLVSGLLPGETAPALPAVAPMRDGVDIHVDFPGEQSRLIYGQLGIKRQDPDYFPLVVGNHVLGGNGTVSLLFDEVREKRGLSYSVSSYFEPLAELGPFLATLQVDHARLAEARQVLNDTLAKFIANGPSQAALDAAKRNLIGGFPLRIDSNSKLTEYLTIIAFYRLPLDYLETYPKFVAEVTVDQVRDAFKRRIALAGMARITVGPAATTK
jgi:zinc protease